MKPARHLRAALVLRLPGGVAGRLKAGDWSESAGGASSGDVASRSGSGCEPLSILVPGSTCRTSRDERSGCSALAPGAQQGGKGRRHIRQAPHARTLGAEGARVQREAAQRAPPASTPSLRVLTVGAKGVRLRTPPLNILDAAWLPRRDNVGSWAASRMTNVHGRCQSTCIRVGSRAIFGKGVIFKLASLLLASAAKPVLSRSFPVFFSVLRHTVPSRCRRGAVVALVSRACRGG